MVDLMRKPPLRTTQVAQCLGLPHGRANHELATAMGGSASLHAAVYFRGGALVDIIANVQPEVKLGRGSGGVRVEVPPRPT